jgi:hypothetical protein
MLLHDLLDATERQQMELHKSQCDVCEKFWLEAVQLNVALENAAKKKILAINPGALTDRIMTSVIRQREPVKVEKWLAELVFGSFTRFALSGISTVLVVLFFMELNPSLTEKPRGPLAGMQVVLKSRDFRWDFRAPKPEKKSLLSSCRDVKNKVDLFCLKSKMKF